MYKTNRQTENETDRKENRKKDRQTSNVLYSLTKLCFGSLLILQQILGKPYFFTSINLALKYQIRSHYNIEVEDKKNRFQFSQNFYSNPNLVSILLEEDSFPPN